MASDLPLTDYELERALAQEAVFDWPRFQAMGLGSADFAHGATSGVVEAAEAVAGRSEPVTLESVATALQRAGKLASMGGLDGLKHLLLANASPDPDRLKELRRLRGLREAAMRAQVMAERGDELAARDALAGAIDQAAHLPTAPVDAVELCTGLLTEITAGARGKKLVHPGLELLGRATGMLMAPSCMVVGAATNTGKALRSTEPVLTPSGWRPIGELRVGDRVIAGDGSVTRVLGVFPQGERELVTVRFNDGSRVDADLDHKWLVSTDSRISRGGRWQVMTTREMLARPGHRGWRIPICGPVQFPEADLPVDPYLLGVLLGDGSLTGLSVRLSKKDDPDIIDRCSSVLPPGVTIRKESGAAGERGALRICPDIGKPNPLLRGMRDIGLMGVGSHGKAIPPMYLRGSVDQRVALLNGLMDTDGTTNVSGNYLSYCTTSPRLRDGVVELVRSLGGIATVSIKLPRYTHNGESRQGRLAYIITIALPESISPFYCARKRDRFVGRVCRKPSRRVESIEPCGHGDAVCIAVEHDSQLFITRDYLVTHNSSWSLAMLMAAAARNVTCGYVSAEDASDVPASRMLAAVTGVSSKRLVTGQINSDDGFDLRERVAELNRYAGKIWFSFCVGGTEIDACAAMSAQAARGAKIIVVDYVQTLSASKQQQNRANDMRWVAQRLKAHAYRLGIVLVLVSQLSRPPKGTKNWEPSKYDLKETGDLENCAEYIVLLWREEEDDSAAIHVKLDKAKLGGIGSRWQMRRNLRSSVLEELPGSFRKPGKE